MCQISIFRVNEIELKLDGVSDDELEEYIAVKWGDTFFSGKVDEWIASDGTTVIESYLNQVETETLLSAVQDDWDDDKILREVMKNDSDPIDLVFSVLREIPLGGNKSVGLEITSADRDNAIFRNIREIVGDPYDQYKKELLELNNLDGLILDLVKGDLGYLMALVTSEGERIEKQHDK
jgi:hypothetical protein